MKPVPHASPPGGSIDEARHGRVSYRRGHVIYDEGDAAQSVYRVEAGCVRLQVNGLEGRRQIVTFLFPGDLFGLSLSRSTAAEAATATELTRYSLQAVLSLSITSADIVVKLINNIDALVNDLAKHVSRVAHLPATERLIWFFEWMNQHGGATYLGSSVHLPMSHRDIADYLGLSPETLSRGFKSLERRGVLTRLGPHTFQVQHRKAQLNAGQNLPEPAHCLGESIGSAA